MYLHLYTELCINVKHDLAFTEDFVEDR